MIDLSTRYLGLELENPIIVSSSGLTNSVEKITKLKEYGAGAVVLKSLFEEQIRYEAGTMADTSDYPEAADYVNYYTKNNSVEEYLQLISDAKSQSDIPVIASINCISGKDWLDFASNVQEANADALELNIFVLPADKSKKPGYYEEQYLDIAAKVKAHVSIPVSVKIGPYFTNLHYMVEQLFFRKIAGVVLFNRFYAPDIDTDQLKITAAEVFSNPSDIRQTLRWVGMISSVYKFQDFDIAASTGVHDGDAAVKLLLAGANAVQVCSVLYKKGPEYVKEILNDIKLWMDKRHYSTINEFRGELNYQNIEDPAMYERAQFMKYFSSQH
jgi:dihydroorotate dehydrogenase (fumarate)